MKLSYNDEITLAANDLSIGDTLRIVCPQCNGGSGNEKSLTVTLSDEGHVIWNCFRAKCEYKGATGVSASLSQRATKIPEKPKIHEISTSELSVQYLEWIRDKWGIIEPRHWYYTPMYGGRIAMSVRGPKGQHRGWVLRDVSGRARAKALTFMDSNEEGISWYRTSPNAPTVLVEDIPSSVRAGQYMNAIALLGTGVGLSRAVEISDNAPRPIVIALDQDATEQSFKILKNYALMWEDTRILPLHKDFKDMTENELKRTLGEYI